MKIIVLLSALGLAGCTSILRGYGEDPQAIVNQRALGMSIGDFFQRYGGPTLREEVRDGTLAFNWEAGATPVAAGPRGPEETVCRLRLATDRNGRIVSALILRDGGGRQHLSRCIDLFASS